MSFPSRSFVRANVIFLLVLAVEMQAADPPLPVKLGAQADRVRIEVNGKLFSEYIFAGANHPYLFPIASADGTELSRNFPMKEVAGEERDHPWQRSLWFAHSSVNNVDFWNEPPGGADAPVAKGHIVQEKILESTNGAVGVLRVRNRWLSPTDELICTDETTLRVRGTGELRILDYEVILHALPDKPLLIGDNKDGTMAIRLAQWMTLPHKAQGKELPGEGHIVTSTGARDGEAWGKRADWCDYFAPHNGKIYGVAIFDHPDNLRHPTWWMAREYGLFGANPFGQHDYEKLKDQPHIGDWTLPAGGSLTLRYRFVFHQGDEKSTGVAQLYRDYVETK